MVAVGVEHREPTGFGRARMQVIEDASAKTLGKFLTENVEPGSRVITDGWTGYQSIVTELGYIHEPRNQSAARRSGEDSGDLLPAVHRVASLAKRWLLSTHHGSAAPEHLPAYLHEFTFRFNRRRSASRGLIFYRLMQLAVGHQPVRYRDIIANPGAKDRVPPSPQGRGHPPSLDQPRALRPWRTANLD